MWVCLRRKRKPKAPNPKQCLLIGTESEGRETGELMGGSPRFEGRRDAPGFAEMRRRPLSNDLIRHNEPLRAL